MMTLEQMKELSDKNGGYLFRDQEGAYQVIGPFIVPVRVIWRSRFTGKGTGSGSYAHCSVFVTSSSNPAKQQLWTAEDRKFDSYNLSSDGLSESQRTVHLSAFNSITLMFEAYNEHADTEVSSFRVSAPWTVH